MFLLPTKGLFWGPNSACSDYKKVKLLQPETSRTGLSATKCNTATCWSFTAQKDL